MIPKSKFVSIFPEKGVAHFQGTFKNEGNADSYNGLLSYAAHAGYSNAFIVIGRDFEEALVETDRVLLRSHSRDSFVARDKDRFWLFVSLGTSLTRPRHKASGPLELDTRNKSLSLRYAEIAEGELVDQIAGFMYWIPLGHLPEGEYTIELMEKGKSRPRFTRTVGVRYR